MISVDYEQVVYNGNGSQTAWPYSFPIYDGDVVRLILLDADGTETDITQDYFVDVPGSTVYYPGYAPGEEPPVADQPPKLQSGQKLIVYRDTEITQDSDLGDKWPFDVIEKGLDKLTMILQEKAFALARCLKISQGQAAEIDNYDPTVPLAADKVICGNAAGDGFEAREALMEVNGAWDGEGRQIHSVADPTGDQDAATKNYVDTLTDNNFMKLQPDGTAWEGRNLPISNVAGPLLQQQAATKNYVDSIIAGIVAAGNDVVVLDNVDTLRATDLTDGMYAGTAGNIEVGDGEGGFYYIRTKTVSDVDDGINIIILDNDNVAQRIYENKNTVCFNNVADMKATPLPIGSSVVTKGYHTIGDNGSGFYNIRSAQDSDVDNGGSIIILDNGNVAELITNGVVNVKQFGAVGDGVTDDTSAVQNAFAFATQGMKLTGKGTYVVNESATTNASEISDMTFIIDRNKSIVSLSSCVILNCKFTRDLSTYMDVTGRGEFLLAVYGELVTIKNCDFSNSVSALYGGRDETKKVTVDGCYFHNLPQSPDASVRGVNGYGIVTEGAETVEVVNNTFVDVGRHCVYLSNRGVDTPDGEITAWTKQAFIRDNIFKATDKEPDKYVTKYECPIMDKYVEKCFIENNAFIDTHCAIKTGESLQDNFKINLFVTNNYFEGIYDKSGYVGGCVFSSNPVNGTNIKNVYVNNNHFKDCSVSCFDPTNIAYASFCDNYMDTIRGIYAGESSRTSNAISTIVVNGNKGRLQYGFFYCYNGLKYLEVSDNMLSASLKGIECEKPVSDNIYVARNRLHNTNTFASFKNSNNAVVCDNFCETTQNFGYFNDDITPTLYWGRNHNINIVGSPTVIDI